MNAIDWLLVLLIIGAVAYRLDYLPNIDPNYHSVEDLAKGSTPTGYISSEGFVDNRDWSSSGDTTYYLYSKDRKYKIPLMGNIPPIKNDACGAIMVYPEYRVTGTTFVMLSHSQHPTDQVGITVINYTLIECKNAADLA